LDGQLLIHLQYATVILPVVFYVYKTLSHTPRGGGIKSVNVR